MTYLELAPVLYRTHGDDLGWTCPDGSPMAAWDRLSTTEQAHWGIIAKAAIRAIEPPDPPEGG